MCKRLAFVLAILLVLTACQPGPAPALTPTPPEGPTPILLNTRTPTPSLQEPLPATPGMPATSATVTPTVRPPEGPTVELQLIAEGLSAPLALRSAGDGSGRLFVVDQIGLIRIIDAQGRLQPEPFLDLRDRMVELRGGYDERGLLGLAFHPAYAQNGRFFVYYSAPLRPDAPEGWNHTSHVSEFQVSAATPNQADPASERLMLAIDQPQANHNGGQITFGPDGYLYVPLGDGGGANDVGVGHSAIGNGQDITNLLGSILRIDVNGKPYTIPPDNPFVGRDGQDEIFAYGFRNPFHISFDAGGQHALFAADAGQYLWEEVNLVVKGNNYGWNLWEGTHCFNPATPHEVPDACPAAGFNNEPLTNPVIEFPNAQQTNGIAEVVVGGYMYRGQALPALQGRYVFGGWSRGRGASRGVLLMATPSQSPGELWPYTQIRIANAPDGELDAYLLSFGQDQDLELYALTSNEQGPSGTTGKVYKLAPPADVTTKP